MKITDELILTAGPVITHREIEYANDAVINGWNLHHSDYIKKFEEAAASYLGVRYAMATSSCTGALHLSLLAMGIGPGDEVIVPETTWIATVSAVKYVGATPVFADIEPDTWVMDPASVEKLITPKTKVIIPVHLYGNPVDMDPIIHLAEKYGIDILEDAAPSIGAEYKGRKTGTMGRAAAFSFQGAKALVTGEGGLFVTNDQELYERVRFIGDHGRDRINTFFNSEIGYKYKMSNVQAALGLAQIERAEEIVAKKRQLFNWYHERLKDLDCIKLNVERPWARSIYWMSSIVLDKDLSITRDEFMKQLKARNIDTRPFFYPISSFPMFKGVEVDNPVAYDVPLRAINLPSGHGRTEEEIDYICDHIRDILSFKPNSSSQPWGWLEYRDKINGIFKETKGHQKPESFLNIQNNGVKLGTLVPITNRSLENNEVIEMLANWRVKAQEWFLTQFKVTLEGTKSWLNSQVLNKTDRIMFLVTDSAEKPVGHVGLFRINYQEKTCELDNIVRGIEGVFPGAMFHGCRSLINWAFDTLGMDKIYLRVISDNNRAIELYNKLGFKEIIRTPLQRITEGDSTRWIDVIGNPYFEVTRYCITMKLSKDEWKDKHGN